MCVWAGEAVIQLHLKPSAGDRFALQLSIPGLVRTPYAENDAVEAAGYRFKLLRLLPYPRAGHNMPEPRYRALLAVEEN